MIGLQKIYFFKTTDKSPYIFNADSTVFGTVTPKNVNNTIITTLQLKQSQTIEFTECFQGLLDYDVGLDFEKSLPQRNFNPIYNYRLLVENENSTHIYSESVNELIRQLSSDVYSIVYQTKENFWFICYADFEITNTVINDEAIAQLNFQSLDAKEEIYKIENFSLI